MMNVGLMVGNDIPEVSPKNKDRAEKYWMYGADAKELAEAWGKPVAMAELKKCGNCEYFNNKARTLKALNADATQGACMKFKFLCSQDESCQAWETSDMMHEEEED